jgi:hypothetical protein
VTNLDEYRRLANRSTFHRRKAEAMGWTFRDIDVMLHPRFDGVLLKCDFICVCGTLERFQAIIDGMQLTTKFDAAAYLFDPARHLFDNGSFSREHLIADGFDPEFIERVLKIAQEYAE